MNKAELFLKATQKNAIRRDSGLPLLDIREEMKKETARQQIIEYGKAVIEYKDDFNRIYNEICNHHINVTGSDLRKSFGGRAALAIQAEKKFKDFLKNIGYQLPENQNSIKYGKES